MSAALTESEPQAGAGTLLVSGSHDTIIIGGGISGLACARHLCDRGRQFLLITENIGGRIRPSAAGRVNLGAYYVRSDYRHVNRFVERGRPINRLGVARHDHNGSYDYWNHRLLLHLPQAGRFLNVLHEFRRRYEIFKDHCLTTSQAEALRADPLLWRLYREPAGRFIRRHRVEAIATHYLAPAVHGTAFTSVNRLTAFSLLLLALPALDPIYEFTFRFDRLLAGFEDSVRFDTVTAVTPTAVGYSVRTRSGGTFRADHVVVATPIQVSARLLGLSDLKRPVGAHSFLVRGRLRRPWAQATINLFPEDDPTLAIARQEDGSTLFCSVLEQPDFARFFTSWEVVEHQHWQPAFHFEGEALLECEQKPDLYLIGDHNICSLEDAYLTGMYAGNRIIAAATKAASHRKPATTG